MQKIDCQTKSTWGIIDVKEQIWPTNLKYLWLSLNISWPFLISIDTYVCTISNVISINKEKETKSAKEGIDKWSEKKE